MRKGEKALCMGCDRFAPLKTSIATLYIKGLVGLHV